YGDYCTGKIWGATRTVTGSWSTGLFSPRAAGLTTFGEDAAGEIYLATESGRLARVVDANPAVAPTVVSVEPVSGSTRGGESVIVTGSGFASGVTVLFGGVLATSVTILDSNGTQLRLTTPAHAAGIVDVVASNPDGRSGTFTSGYGYAAPSRVALPPRIPRTVTRP
ncbi:MAG TPA: IPT/TIG domain-containing protein, partial [Thermoanaerobaculia bacterium]